jgi:hypothetical protein
MPNRLNPGCQCCGCRLFRFPSWTNWDLTEAEVIDDELVLANGETSDITLSSSSTHYQVTSYVKAETGVATNVKLTVSGTNWVRVKIESTRTLIEMSVMLGREIRVYNPTGTLISDSCIIQRRPTVGGAIVRAVVVQKQCGHVTTQSVLLYDASDYLVQTVTYGQDIGANLVLSSMEITNDHADDVVISSIEIDGDASPGGNTECEPTCSSNSFCRLQWLPWQMSVVLSGYGTLVTRQGTIDYTWDFSVMNGTWIAVADSLKSGCEYHFPTSASPQFRRNVTMPNIPYTYIDSAGIFPPGSGSIPQQLQCFSVPGGSPSFTFLSCHDGVLQYATNCDVGSSGTLEHGDNTGLTASDTNTANWEIILEAV